MAVDIKIKVFSDILLWKLLDAVVTLRLNRLHGILKWHGLHCWNVTAELKPLIFIIFMWHVPVFLRIVDVFIQYSVVHNTNVQGNHFRPIWWPSSDMCVRTCKRNCAIVYITFDKKILFPYVIIKQVKLRLMVKKQCKISWKLYMKRKFGHVINERIYLL